MNKPDGLHYLGGRWVSTQNLKISVFDLSVLRGFGAFDYLRTYNNKPFHLDDHLQRFFRSTKLLGLKIPVSKQGLATIVATGLQRNHFDETGIRFLLTGGASLDSVTPGKSQLIVVFQPIARYEEEFYSKGIKVITFPTPRHIAGAKSLNYLTAIVAMQQAQAAKAVEAIYIDPEVAAAAQNTTRKLYEGTRTNFFIVAGGVLVTPSSDILPGITRQVVVELAKSLGLPIEERPIELAELQTASEAFITSSDKEIMPVVRVDKFVIGSGKPGKLTRRLMSAFKDYTSKA